MKNKCTAGLLAIVLLCLSCNKEQQEQEMIQAALDVKKKLFVKKAEQKCQLLLMEKADALADSILLNKINVRNPIERPPRPERPETPVVQFKDTIPLIKPSRSRKDLSEINDTINQGNNLRKTE